MRTARSFPTAIALLASLLVSLIMPVSVSGDGIDVITNSVEHSFAQHATFRLEATSDSAISEVYLFFRATHADETEKKRMEVEEPSREIDIEYVHDLRHYPLPPFADIAYWWQIEDADGNQLKTARKQFQYTDNRFRWERLDAGGIEIHWIEGQGDPAFAQTALDIAATSVKEINTELRAPVPDPLQVYIYDSERNLQAAMILTGRDWVGGQAHPGLGVVVIAVSAEQGYTSRLKRYLPHEITHLLVYERTTAEGYRNVPEWLNEGLATVNEQLPTPEYAIALEEAHNRGQLLSLEELCVPFSPDPRTAILSYAESSSVVAFIRKEYGGEGIRALLSAYADGASCTSGVENGLGISFNKLENQWRRSLEPEAEWRAVLDQVGVWVGLSLLGLLGALPMMMDLHRRSGE